MVIDDHVINLTIDPRLTHMLEMQRTLQLMYNEGKSIEEFTPEERMQAIRDNVLALEDELHEALAETGWKPWASSNHLNTEAFKSEMVDAWHFFMNLMLHSGMTANDLYQGYVKKNAKNIQRQADGYDGVTTKCIHCKRAYDDEAVECLPTTPEGPAWCAASNCHYASDGTNLDARTPAQATRYNEMNSL